MVVVVVGVVDLVVVVDAPNDSPACLCLLPMGGGGGRREEMGTLVVDSNGKRKEKEWMEDVGNFGDGGKDGRGCWEEELREVERQRL